MKDHIVLITIVKLLIPFILLYALYIQFHGEYSPGGGFQAGAIVATAIILYSLLEGERAALRAVPRSAQLAMVVGGAFQNFNSYKPTVEAFLEDRPCIMLDLPSLGNNEQLVPELSGEDMADLLKEFFVRL